MNKNKPRMSVPIPPIHHLTRSSCNKPRKKKKGIQIRNKDIKLYLFRKMISI